jgi:hypothetical protein
VLQVTLPEDMEGILGGSSNLTIVVPPSQPTEATTESPRSPGFVLSTKTNSEDHDVEAAPPGASKQKSITAEEVVTPTTVSSGNSGSEVAPTLACGQRVVSRSGRMYKVCVTSPPCPSAAVRDTCGGNHVCPCHHEPVRSLCFESTCICQAWS